MKIYFATEPIRQEQNPLTDKGAYNRLTSYFFWYKIKNFSDYIHTGRLSK